MDRFEGIGAACIAKFYEAGMAGRIMWGDKEVALGRRNHTSRISDTGPWLLRECVYTPPEPAYRDASPGEALDAWLAGKEVQAQNKHEPDYWGTIPKGAMDWVYMAQEARYRIKED